MNRALDIEIPGRAPVEASATIARSATELRSRIDAWRDAGLTVALVPTMGALHEGHLSLSRLAGEHADRVVASIFVNPTQFGPDEDLGRYPRRERDDVALLSSNQCDLVFLPGVETIYPSGEVTFIDLDETTGAPSAGMEGALRPGHFRGVATVVAKLFNLARPDIAVFGEKDAQQLAVVRRMVRDLHFEIEIVAHPTVREDDGLAMSSRNAYLSPEQRTAAGTIYGTLQRARRLIEGGERDADVVRQAMDHLLAAEPLFDVNYAEVVDADSFCPIQTIQGEVTLPVAVDLAGTRLLDNIRINPTED